MARDVTIKIRLTDKMVDEIRNMKPDSNDMSAASYECIMELQTQAIEGVKAEVYKQDNANRV